MAVDRQVGGDPVTGAPRWYLRLRGEEKEFVTVWLTLRQRTLRHEAQFMPAPETNVEATWEYLLTRNADLIGLAFALGAEDAVYLVGRDPGARGSTTTSSTGSSARRWPTPTSASPRPCPSATPAATVAGRSPSAEAARGPGGPPGGRRGPAGSVRPWHPSSSWSAAERWAPPWSAACSTPDGRRADELVVSEVDAGQRARLEEAHPGLTVVGGPVEAVDVLLAVKPDVAEPVLLTLAANGARRVLSIVAGVPTARLEAVMPSGSVVVRAMPNTPALIGAGVAGLSGGMAATSADLDWAEGILAAVGTVVRLPERQLDAVTGVSGSGPAYVFLVAEALVEAGVTAGLPRDVSRQLVVGTLLGSARMLDETGEEPAELRAAVTSPGGTTAAAVRTLEFKAVRSAFIEAVAAAVERSRQLGR